MPKVNRIITQQLIETLRAAPSGSNGRNLFDGVAQTTRVNVAQHILDNFFLIPLTDVPFRADLDQNLEARANNSHLSVGVLHPDIDPANIYSIVCDWVADYLVVEEIQEKADERYKQLEGDKELAFTLFKASSPANLHHTSFSSMTRKDQQTWLAVAQKARETLA